MADPGTLNRRIRILLVDDSAVYRGFWGRIIQGQPDLEVVTAVNNGLRAIEVVTAQPIDVVVLDVEMPEMDGLTALPKILKARPGVKVVIASSLSKLGSKTALEALALGASDYVAKPTSLADGASALQVGDGLLAKIRAICGKTLAPPRLSISDFKTSKLPSLSVLPKLIVIGSSTGGPTALETLLKALPRSVTQPILIVQHMPQFFTSMLAERLTRECGRPAYEAKASDTVQSGCIYIAPGGHHMTVSRIGSLAKLALNDEPPEHFCRPAGDPLFRSAAAAYGRELLSIVLTGMGEDGRLGSLAVNDSGGKVIAQDEESSVVWGMPGAVAKSGAAHWVLPLTEIASQIEKICVIGVHS